MTDQQTIIALRTEAERLGLIAIEAQHAAALKEREYRIALGEALDQLVMQYSDLAEAWQRQKQKERQNNALHDAT